MRVQVSKDFKLMVDDPQAMKSTLIVGTLVLVLTLFLMLPQANAAMSILKFTVPKMSLAAGSPVIVTGTAMANNATHTNCNVQFQTNQAGYLPVIPKAPAASKYQNWTANSQPLKRGLNILEAQLQCFAPGHLNGPPNLTKHLVHNVTAIAMSSPPSPPSVTTSSSAGAPAVIPILPK